MAHDQLVTLPLLGICNKKHCQIKWGGLRGGLLLAKAVDLLLWGHLLPYSNNAWAQPSQIRSSPDVDWEFWKLKPSSPNWIAFNLGKGALGNEPVNLSVLWIAAEYPATRTQLIYLRNIKHTENTQHSASKHCLAIWLTFSCLVSWNI